MFTIVRKTILHYWSLVYLRMISKKCLIILCKNASYLWIRQLQFPFLPSIGKMEERVRILPLRHCYCTWKEKKSSVFFWFDDMHEKLLNVFLSFWVIVQRLRWEWTPPFTSIYRTSIWNMLSLLICEMNNTRKLFS